MLSHGSLLPTARRIQRAIREGDTPHSRVAIAAGSLTGAILAAPYTVFSVRDAFRAGLGRAFGEPGVEPAGPGAGVVGAHATALPIAEALFDVVRAALPIVCGAFIGALVGALVQYRRGAGRARPGRRRRSPHDELGRRIGRSLLCLAALGGPTLWLAATGIDDATRSPATWLDSSADGVEAVAWWGLAGALAVAGADAWSAFAAWRKRLLMTPAELRAEQRETGAAPELREAWSRERREAAARGTGEIT